MKKSIFFIIATLVVTPLVSLALAMPVPVLAAGAVKVGDTCSDTSVCAAGLACINAKCVADVWGEGSGAGAENIRTATGLGNQDPRTIAASVINIILGFLGIIAVVLIIAGGFMWMTAAGNDEKIGTARKIMTAGVIGLVIVLAAFGIARFVVNALTSATV